MVENPSKHEEWFWKISSLLLAGAIVFSIATLFHFPWHKTLFPNSDFEMGNLTNWRSAGEAMKNQPTFGDNTVYRYRGISNLRGNYWIGTFEKRPTPQSPKGETQGDAPLGELVSVPFTIERGRISFLLGGGNNTNSQGVALEVDGKVVYFERGQGSLIDSEVMSRVTWNVAPWKGRSAKILIEDRSGDAWGHINVDDFRYA